MADNDDVEFPLSAGKMKDKYEHLSNKATSIDASRKSTDLYVSEKALTSYVGV